MTKLPSKGISAGVWRAGLAAVLCAAGAVRADIDVVLEAPTPVLRVGDVFTLELVAASDDQTDQPFIGLDAVLSWDPQLIRFRRDLGGSPFAWTFAGFPCDRNLDQLNADCSSVDYCTECQPTQAVTPFNDGDAFYSVWIFLFGTDPAFAPPEGMLITRLEFEVLAAGPPTAIELQANPGGRTHTRVAALKSVVVTGALISPTLVTATCGDAADFDNDCVIGEVDFADFAACMDGPSLSVNGTPCQPADVDSDTDADLRDLQRVQQGYRRTAE